MYVRSLTVFALFAWFIDIVIPRFIKEEVAFGAVDADTVIPICALADVQPEDTEIIAVGTMRSFNLFGVALFPKLVGELRPYEPDGEMES